MDIDWDKVVMCQSTDKGVKCPDCGGFAEKSDSTQEEIESRLNCGRRFACCCRAFVCCLCNKRILGKAEAPEMD